MYIILEASICDVLMAELSLLGGSTLPKVIVNIQKCSNHSFIDFNIEACYEFEPK